MHILEKGKLVKVDPNPEYCNLLTAICHVRCDNSEMLKREEKDRCMFHRKVKHAQSENYRHTTALELKFVDGLGSHSTHAHRTTRRVLVDRYVISIAGRTRWGCLNESEVKSHALETQKGLAL